MSSPGTQETAAHWSSQRATPNPSLTVRTTRTSTSGRPEGTCHLGVTFFRPHGERSAMRTSVAQAFAENGDVFVLRGNPFEWEGKWLRLPAE
jgi:hypothetical protein